MKNAQAGFGCVIVLLICLLLAGLITVLALEYAEPDPAPGGHEEQSSLQLIDKRADGLTA